MRSSSLAMGLVLSCAVAAAAPQPDPAKVPFKIIPVAGAVSLLQSPAGNIAVLAGDDGVVMVDTGYAASEQPLRAALKQVSDRPLRFVIDTHIHDDHTGGNAAFQREAPIVAQANVRTRLAAGAKVMNHEVPPAPPAALPQITFEDQLTLHLDGEEIRLIHLPGHTDGDSIVWFTRANVVHLGDLFVTYGFPFIDLDSGGHVQGMIAANEKVLSLVPVDAKVIPGHGPVCTTADVREYVAMLKETSARVAAGIAQGKTVAQLQQEKALAGFDKWSHGFFTPEKFIEQLYRDLSAPAP